MIRNMISIIILQSIGTTSIGSIGSSSWTASDASVSAVVASLKPQRKTGCFDGGTKSPNASRPCARHCEQEPLLKIQSTVFWSWWLSGNSKRERSCYHGPNLLTSSFRINDLSNTLQGRKPKNIKQLQYKQFIKKTIQKPICQVTISICQLAPWQCGIAAPALHLQLRGTRSRRSLGREYLIFLIILMILD